METGPGPTAFHLLAEPTGAVCDLDCSYCHFLPEGDAARGLAAW